MPSTIVNSNGWARRDFVRWHQYIGSENELKFKPAVEKTLKMRYPVLTQLGAVRSPRHLVRLLRYWLPSIVCRLRQVRPLIKDPFALFWAEWFANRYGAHIVITIRHPAGFVSSLKRLNWTYDFRHWRDQPLLMKHYLQLFAQEIHHYCTCEPDIIDQAILLWNAIYYVVHLFQERYPLWSFVRIEDLAENPVENFRQLYQKLGLRWDKRAEAQILRFSSSKNRAEVSVEERHSIERDSVATQRTWVKRLTEEELERVRVGVAHVARWYYSEEDWAPGVIERNQ